MVSDHKSTGHDDILAFTQVQDTCTTQLHVPHSYMYHTDTYTTEIYLNILRHISQEVCAVKLRWNGVVVIAYCHDSSVPTNSNSEM